MTRNQKIALGCGGAGCLGLIVVVIAGVLLYFFAYNQTFSTNRNDDDNFNSTTNRNSNSNDNLATNDNDNDNTSSSSSSTSAASMSDDDKHKLYQAALMTGDPELLRRVSVKIGLMDDDYTPGDNYQAFVTEHVTWAIRNTDFAQTVDTPAKAREYVDQNIPN
jgi:cytoskeletal protein RodZ